MNTHPNAVLLQAFEDGEVGPARRGAVEAHLESCAHCRNTLDELRALSRGFSGALARLDAEGEAALARLAAAGPPLRTAVARPAPDRSWLRAAAIAAVLVAGSSVAGLSALWLRDRLEQDATPAAIVESAPAAPRYSSGFTVAAGAGPLRIDLAGLAPDSRVELRLVDDDHVTIDVVAADAPIRFGDRRAGRIEVAVNGHAEVAIALPRSLSGATVAVDGVVRATRSDGGIEITPGMGGVTVVVEES